MRAVWPWVAVLMLAVALVVLMAARGSVRDEEVPAYPSMGEFR